VANADRADLGTSTRSFPIPSLPDVDGWPSGRVTDDQAGRLGLAESFWTDQRQAWRTALDPWTPGAAAGRILEGILKRAGSEDETQRALWHLWVSYSRAGLGDTARKWLDASAGYPTPAVTLDRVWDQAFRVGDLAGARALWPATAPAFPSADDQRKARLLRQKLFLGTRSLAGVDADNYISTLALDQDDVWAGTWDGAVVRWSLATDQTDLLLHAGTTPSPVKVLTVTPWFVYAFQDLGFQRYSKVAGGWRPFDYPTGWTGLRIQAVVAEGDETLWVATLGQGLWKWDQGTWTLVDDQGGGPFLNALAPDGRGGFWIGTKDRGLWNWNSGTWTPVPTTGGPGPTNISVVQPAPDGGRWAVGTWGEGTWVLDQGVLVPLSRGKEYVVSAAWDRGAPVWASLDEGLGWSSGPDTLAVGPLDGLTGAGVSSLVTWEGRWIWGTTGQGLGWWSEHENPALLR
jgi:hypothetical protein